MIVLVEGTTISYIKFLEAAIEFSGTIEGVERVTMYLPIDSTNGVSFVKDDLIYFTAVAETGLSGSGLALSNFPSDAVFYGSYRQGVYFSMAEEEVGNVYKSSATYFRVSRGEFPLSNLEFVGQVNTEEQTEVNLLFYNTDLDVYDFYRLNYFRSDVGRYTVPASTTGILYFNANGHLQDSVSATIVGISTQYGGQSFGQPTFYVQTLQNTNYGCDSNIYTTAYVERTYDGYENIDLTEISIDALSTFTFTNPELTDLATGDFDFSGAYVYPGEDCYANTSFDDVASADLFAYIGQGVFTLEFPEVFTCDDPYEYTVDDFFLVDGSSSNMLVAPLSNDASGINFDSDHVGAAVGETILYGTIIDNTSDAPN